MYGLKDSIKDNLVECFVKLGFTDAPLSFNYPDRTLAALLFGVEKCKQTFAKADKSDDKNASEIGGEQLLTRLAEELASAKDTLGECTVRRRKDGYSITVPREGVRRAFSTFDRGGFLPSLLDAISAHGATREHVRAVFERSERPYVATPSDDADFDEFITVTDGSDPYIYLFKFDGHHVDYHRLLPADFYEIYKK